MALPEAVSKLLAQGEAAYKAGLSAANPPPSTGPYTFQLGKVVANPAKSQGVDVVIVAVPWTVHNSDLYKDYKFQKKYWMNSERDAADLATIAALLSSAVAASEGKASAGAPATLAETYDLLTRYADRAFFTVEVKVVNSADGTKTYHNFTFNACAIAG